MPLSTTKSVEGERIVRFRSRRVTKITAIWSPRYTITPAIARRLMEIVAARTVVERTPLPPTAWRLNCAAASGALDALLDAHRKGNRLTLAEADRVIRDVQATIQGRERDVREVRNYWDALLRVEEWAAQRKPFSRGYDPAVARSGRARR